MKKISSFQTIAAAITLVVVMSSCKKDFGNLNSPTVESFLDNATESQLNNLVTGTESGMRNSLSFYLDDVGTLGREGYRFSPSEPRYVTDLLGANDNTLTNSNFYITTPWAARYRVVKNCNVLIESANNSTSISAEQKKGYTGFAKTIKAYQLLLNLNLTASNGIRVDVSDPNNLGPILSNADALNGISGLLDEAKTELAAATMNLPLSSGFAGFKDAAGFTRFNRALAARVAVYQQKWDVALTALTQSFFGLNANLNVGVSHVFSTGSGDQLNPMFIPQNQNGEIRVAHPSFVSDIQAGDNRIEKVSVRTTTASLNDLSSNWDVWVYTSSTARLPIIRNEELVLLYAEAKLQKGDGASLNEAVGALNVIRTNHNLGNYPGAVTQAALLDEMLRQKRFSLFYEGHRWIDLRRYDRLNQLPLDRANDNVWATFPLPISEN
jgi:hypothetical protein